MVKQALLLSFTILSISACSTQQVVSNTVDSAIYVAKIPTRAAGAVVGTAGGIVGGTVGGLVAGNMGEKYGKMAGQSAARNAVP